MLDKDFDKYLRQGLESAKFDWDKESMWDDIEKELPQEEKRRWPFIFFLLGTLVVSAGIFYLAISSATETSPKQEELKLYDISANVSNEVVAENINTSLLEDRDQVQDQTQDQVQVETQLEVQDQVQVQVEVKDQIHTQGQTHPRISEANKNQNVEVGSVDVSSTSSAVENQQDTESSLTNQLVSENINETEPETLINETIQYSYVENIAYLPTSLNSINANKDAIETLTINLSEYPVVKVHEPQAMPIQFGVFADVAQASRQLSSDADGIRLLEEREKSQKVLERIGAGLKLNMQLSRKWGLDVALQYERITEQMDFTERINTEMVEFVDTAAFYINYLGETQFVGEDRLVKRTSITEYRRFNTHHFVMMPIKLNYNLFTPKTIIKLNIGPVLNLYQSYDGATISLQDNGDLVLDESAVDITSNSLISAFEIGASAEYSIGKGVSLFGGINYRKALDGFSLAHNIDQRYDALGLQTGILFNLN